MHSITQQHIRERLWYRYQRRLAPYLFISPFYILFVVFALGPLIAALYFSMIKWPGTGPMTFLGLANYLELFEDEIFLKSLGNTTYYAIGAVFVILPVALFLALLINAAVVRAKSLFRIAFILPVLTSTVAATIMFLLMFEHQYGLFNVALEAVGLNALKWLDEELVKLSVLLVAAWRYTGLSMLYFLAGLQSIPTDVYEAASVDGAGRWTTFWQITLPLLRPVSLFVVVVSIIGSFQFFAEPLLLAGGGPNNASLTIANYLYRVGFSYLRMGYASAVGYILAVIIFILTLLQLKFFGAFGRS
ncbi:MAG: sugar ABC transporter permease [Caldilineaceae bacterium SB0668_bin_21]|nr:sugar ABC transporter permease [Caldilineaceae bacterium SB0668_bin_21]MYC22547.1 sugar ABC transporter permease [Caldilineaceae bacterium SB0662_bin_25]